MGEGGGRGKREGGQRSGQLDFQAQPPAFPSAAEMTKRCFENSGPTRSALSRTRTGGQLQLPLKEAMGNAVQLSGSQGPAPWYSSQSEDGTGMEE